MPFNSIKRDHPSLWASNAHLFPQQEGGGGSPVMGGWGGFGQPGQRESIHRSEGDEIAADDARGLRVIALNICLVLLALFGVFVLGQIAAFLSVLVLSFAFARRFYKAAPVQIVSGAIIVSALWVFMVLQYWWGSILSWYPFAFILPWWLLIPIEAVIVAAWFGVRDLRKAHHRSLYNRNWPPTFRPLQPDVGPYYAGEYSLDQYEPTDEELTQYITAALQNNPNLIREVVRVVPTYGANPGNGHLQAQMQAAAERAHPEGPAVQVEQPTPEQKPEKPEELFMSPGGYELKWRDFVTFIWSGVDVGISTPTWSASQGWTKTYIGELQSAARQFGIADYNGVGSKNRLKITTKAEAARELERIHDLLYPTAPPRKASEPSQDETAAT